MRRTLLFASLLAVAAVCAAPAFASDEVFDQTYPLHSGGSVRLENVNGGVEVRAWDREEVQIHAVKTARRNPLDMARVRIEVDAQPDAISIHTRYPQDDGVEVYVEYRVNVPRRVLLPRVATVNGNVRVSGVEAVGELRSVNGNVEAANCAGRLSAHTTNGGIRLELRRLDPGGTLAAETVNGSVVVALPPSTAGDLDVRNLNGDFQSEFPITVQGTMSMREFHAKLGAGGIPIRIRTVNGSVRIETYRTTV